MGSDLFDKQRANIQKVTQSISVGDLENKTGKPFNDATDVTVGKWPIVFNIEKSHPIQKIEIHYRDTAIDGLFVTYRLIDTGKGKGGSSPAVRHGSKNGKIRDTIVFGESEVLLAVTGRAGTNANDEIGIFEMTFVKVDTGTGEITQKKYGGDDTAPVFYATGPIIGFAGIQDNNDNVTQLGLKALSFLSSPTPIDECGL